MAKKGANGELSDRTRDKAKINTYSSFSVEDPYEYLSGLNHYHESETIPGTVPIGRTHPQHVKGGLYPDRLTGSPFTVPRSVNKQTHFYRTLPSTSASDYVEWKPNSKKHDLGLSNLTFKPNPYMYLPVEIDPSDDFVSGLRLLVGVGDPAMRKGVAYYIYAAGKDMNENQVFTTADGDLCLVAEKGSIDVKTEMGPLRLRPGELAVIPRGVRFHVSLVEGPARGYIVETFVDHFELPELGIIGSVGLANARDFQIVKLQQPYKPGPDTEIINKFCGKLFTATMKGTVFNIIGWHGTFYPYKYDMGRFNTMGSISYDHADPCIWTVLTVKSEVEGVPAVDVLAIPPRWVVHEDTFRPPSYHRNIACEFILFVKGSLSGDPADTSMVGRTTLYPGMTPHGPTRAEWEVGTSEEQVPFRVGNDNMLVMFESSYVLGLSEYAATTEHKIPLGDRYSELDPAQISA